jgi:hypothetical protein
LPDLFPSPIKATKGQFYKWTIRDPLFIIGFRELLIFSVDVYEGRRRRTKKQKKRTREEHEEKS